MEFEAFVVWTPLVSELAGGKETTMLMMSYCNSVYRHTTHDSLCNLRNDGLSMLRQVQVETSEAVRGKVEAHQELERSVRELGAQVIPDTV